MRNAPFWVQDRRAEMKSPDRQDQRFGTIWNDIQASGTLWNALERNPEFLQVDGQLKDNYKSGVVWNAKNDS